MAKNLSWKKMWGLIQLYADDMEERGSIRFLAFLEENFPQHRVSLYEKGNPDRYEQMLQAVAADPRWRALFIRLGKYCERGGVSNE